MKIFLVFFAVFAARFPQAKAQTCTSLKNPACQCRDTLPPAVYIHNGSFEEHTPDCFDDGLDINKTQYLAYWTYGDPEERPRYYYTGCRYVDDYLKCRNILPPPDGNAFVGIFDLGDGGYGAKAYLATCLSNPLIAGVKYTFEFYVGFCPGYKFKEFVIFGHPDCDSLPFSALADIGCPTNVNADGGGWVRQGWVQLGSAILSGEGGWLKARIDFIPPENINGFLFGTNCTNAGPQDAFAYPDYYVDKFALTETSLLNFRTIKADSGDCSHGVLLHAPPAISVLGYQWYKDSLAIAGATDSVYTVPANSQATGNYNVSLSFLHTCLLTDPLYVDMSVLGNYSLGRDTLICDDDSLILNPGIAHANYKWQDGSTKKKYIVKQPGSYSVQITNMFGCSVTKSIKVSFQQCKTCPVYVPNAFTPNNDGTNDLFTIKSNCARIDDFTFLVYSRWGQPLFKTSDVKKGWDGTYRGKQQPPGVYVYFLTYKRFGVPGLQEQKGAFTLLR